MPDVVCKPVFFFTVCVAILLLPMQLVVCWILAAAIHELGHYLALRATGTKVFKITIGAMGAIMETEPMTGWKSIVCALAGPFSGLLLMFLMRPFPLLAFCGLIQSACNLLPLLPLDGGRAVSGALSYLPFGKSALFVVELCTMVLLVLIGIYLMIQYSLGLYPLLLVVFLLIRRKLSCKQNPQRVQ